MALVLVKGQNAALASARLRVTVETRSPADLSALLLAESGRVRSDADFVFYNQPQGTGVSCRPAGSGLPERIEVDLAAVPAEVSRVLAAVSLDGATPFGAGPAPVAQLVDADGAQVATFVIDGLSDERVVIAWEFYRRAGGWKLRAVGQGYAGGLSELATTCGVQVEQEAAPTVAVPVPTPSPVGTGTGSIPPAPTRPPHQPGPATPGPAHQHGATNQAGRPGATNQGGLAGGRSKPPAAQPAVVGGPPVGGLSQERLYDQVWSIFQDAARSTSALRSATQYAAHRRDEEVDRLLADPRARNSPATAAARAEADRRHDELVARAGADHRRDVSQLVTELSQLAASLPAPLAQWDSRVWRGWHPPQERAAAIRVGDLHLPEAPQMRIPLLFRLPLAQALWIDPAGADRTAATALARTIITRLLAAHPAGQLTVSVADLAGGGAAVQGLRTGGGLSGPPVTTPAELAELLDSLVARVDLAHMAFRSGDATLARGLVERRLLVLHDFPFGFDERSVAQIQYLLNEGPPAGVYLLVIADPGDSATLGPLVSALWRSMSRLPAVPDDHIGDPWVGLSWTFTPDSAGSGNAVDAVLGRLAGPVDPQ